jgi:hypothetical protein
MPVDGRVARQEKQRGIRIPRNVYRQVVFCLAEGYTCPTDGGKHNHIGKHGTQRQFPGEWVEYPKVPGGGQ